MTLSLEEHPAFPLILLICVATVLGEMDKKEGMVFVDLPFKRQAMISISLGVNSTPRMVFKYEV